MEGKRTAGTPIKGGRNRDGTDGLHGVDLRTRSARRWRTLFHSFNHAATAPDGMTRENLCRRAATLTLELERLDTLAAAGKPLDGDLLVRLSNSLDRVLERLGLTTPQEQPKPDPRAALNKILEEESKQNADND